MNKDNFEAIIEDLKAKNAELIGLYDNLMFYYKTLNLTAKMLKIENRILRAKLNKSESIQELVYDGLGDK